ncbi:MAG: coenzyme F420-0:L-glutamate ligase / coenzyme F420:gamma-L-glutamate ligase [Micromonosporaceae bacterium]|nr:coenzyme F420-0:L-glutamate ligase / coenzyme F420:gamma-L-glutamate ligase [Micromonosporaceae bacterium]
MLEIRPVVGIGEVLPGADLAAVIMDAAPWIVDDDVLVVTSKIVSKAEGRLVEIPADGPEREAAREAVVDAETARPVAARGRTRIVMTRHGLVLAAAGVDASNVVATRLVLLPVDPDASARALRSALRDRYGRRVAVVVTDTMGRPWRVGQTDVAIGAAGVAPIRDHRGEIDPYGNELHVTQVAVIDELAAAGDLVKGKHDQIPVAVIRGLTAPPVDAAGLGDAAPPVDAAPPGYVEDGPGARELVRRPDEDMFSLGTAEARALGRWDAASIVDATAFAAGAVDPTLIGDALAAVDTHPASVSATKPTFVHVTAARAGDRLRDLGPTGTAEVVVGYLPADADRPAVARAGAAVHRLRAGLAAAGLATTWVAVDDAVFAAVADLPAGHTQLCLLAIGAPATRSP